ncbi:MAG: AIPR family protein [Candidatus Omnitrophica bacterium]|nr:AIPR family protein [Candidatus Omnitrophota bacterium]
MGNDLTFEAFEKEWLVDIKSGNPNTVELGRRFSRKLVSQWLDFAEDIESPEDIVYCDGTGDGGVDIAYLQRGDDSEENSNGGDTWYLVQSKYGTAFAGTETLLEEAHKLIDTIDGKRSRLSSLAAGLVERLQTFRQQASEKDKIVFVYATQKPLSEDEKRVLEDIRAMGKNRLGVMFETDAVSLETIYHRTLEEVSHVKKTRVSITAHLVPSGEEMLVGSVGLVQLFDFLKKYKVSTGDIDLLYEKNVRKFLGNRRKVNKGIENTLLTKPERFGLYNNGITIVVEAFQKIPNNTTEYELTEPFVVNGCQTTRTIWEVLYKKLEAGGTGQNPELEAWKRTLGKGIVVIKIVIFPRKSGHNEELVAV